MRFVRCTHVGIRRTKHLHSRGKKMEEWETTNDTRTPTEDSELSVAGGIKADTRVAESRLVDILRLCPQTLLRRGELS